MNAVKIQLQDGAGAAASGDAGLYDRQLPQIRTFTVFGRSPTCPEPETTRRRAGMGDAHIRFPML